ncbi:hypothetical protein GAP32_379 [Cronobacter phage vB_CsaM_GAP32]|uniref:Uncharacterized protein n=1 Tax=Cronobacter phage vB_CsaM_GAP32 TaxID=1141136 RepID=K4F6D7_9CAUD|nr:hypothetical protein GAP32_379 [Cronobacter phage vB_CsaM_GAP32]AFC21831.1 hypothetical protein GAP32_379 [Cronobacter phage vB_CsaM_GAP32]
MSTKVTFKVNDEDMEYARSIWDSADYVLSEVNRILAERGIDIKFNVDNCDEDEYLEQYWNADHPDYNGGIIIEESEKVDECSFMDEQIK